MPATAIPVDTGMADGLVGMCVQVLSPISTSRERPIVSVRRAREMKLAGTRNMGRYEIVPLAFNRSGDPPVDVPVEEFLEALARPTQHLEWCVEGTQQR